MPAKNKVKFNLKNVHIAPINKETGLYDEVFALPGAVNLSLEAQGDIEPFYADGIVYYQSAANNGYEGDLEVAMITDEFREKIFGEKPNIDGVTVEDVNVQYNDFALGFQVDGDIHETLFWYYRVSATRPTTEAATTEGNKTPQTDTLTISCVANDDGRVRVKTTDATDAATRAAWFNEVYSPDKYTLVGEEGVNALKDTDMVGEKKANEICTITVAVSGTDVTVTGTSKNISEPWTEFGAANNTGHFVVIQVPQWFVGKKVEMETSSGKKFTYKSFDSSRQLVIRLDDYEGEKIATFTINGIVAMTVDFSGVTLEG